MMSQCYYCKGQQHVQRSAAAKGEIRADNRDWRHSEASWAHTSKILRYGRCRCLPVASGHKKATKELMHLVAHNAGADQSDWILQYTRLQLETGQPEVTRCLAFPAALMQDAFLGL